MENRAFILHFGKIDNKKNRNLCLFTTAAAIDDRQPVDEQIVEKKSRSPIAAVAHSSQVALSENSCTTAGSLKTKMMSAYMTPILTVQRPSFARSRSALDEIASRFGFTRG